MLQPYNGSRLTGEEREEYFGGFQKKMAAYMLHYLIRALFFYFWAHLWALYPIHVSLSSSLLVRVSKQIPENAPFPHKSQAILSWIILILRGLKLWLSFHRPVPALGLRIKPA